MSTTQHAYTTAAGLVRVVDGQALADGRHIATLWGRWNSTTVLFISTGRRSDADTQAAMDALQPAYGGRLRFVASTADWSGK